VQFADSAEGEAVKSKIETLLAGTLNAERATSTM
jgi:type IV pilus assembly protein PilZ